MKKNRTQRLLAVLAGVIAISLLSAACTPEQLNTYQQLTGNTLSQTDQDALLALDDKPMDVPGGAIILPDGSVLTPMSCSDIQAHINTDFAYNMDDPEPAMKAFVAVAGCRGWTTAQIDSWRTAISDIMHFESHYCPNVLGGAVIGQKAGCILKRQGTRSDAGFGQLISIHYRHTTPGTGWLCDQEGLCSKWDIIASPWNSMTALVALVERSGTAGWCYNRSARKLHWKTCSNPGLDVG